MRRCDRGGADGPAGVVQKVQFSHTVRRLMDGRARIRRSAGQSPSASAASFRSSRCSFSFTGASVRLRTRLSFS